MADERVVEVEGLHKRFGRVQALRGLDLQVRLVSVTAEQRERLDALAAQHGVPVDELGTTGGDALVVEGQYEVPVSEVKSVWSATLPAALG